MAWYLVKHTENLTFTLPLQLEQTSFQIRFLWICNGETLAIAYLLWSELSSETWWDLFRGRWSFLRSW